jgi:hypothetical protein
MSALGVSLIVFVVTLVATALGIFFNRVLPEHHLTKESKEIIHLGIGVIVTLTALVLGLLIASAKQSFDTKSDEIRQGSIKIIQIDRALRDYGPEASGARELLRRWVARNAAAWSLESGPVTSDQEGGAVWTAFQSTLRALVPANEGQRGIIAKINDLDDDIAKTRWLLTEQSASSIQTPFLLVLILWLGIIFASFGLFAPRNGTVFAVILLSALSLSTAIYLILELDQPFDGAIRISDAPLRTVQRELAR